MLNAGKSALTVGRAPKSDVVCALFGAVLGLEIGGNSLKLIEMMARGTLSGISWNHLELSLPPEDAGELHLVVKDLSMNGTGMRLSPSEPMQKVAKENEVEILGLARKRVHCQRLIEQYTQYKGLRCP